MRLSSWFLPPKRRTRRRPAQRGPSWSAPLVVRRLESRRVLNASIQNIIVPEVVNEGETFEVSAEATGLPPLFFDWTIYRDGEQVDTRFTQSFEYTATVDGTYLFELRLSDGAQSVDIDSATVIVNNVEPPPGAMIQEITAPMMVNEGDTFAVSAEGTGLSPLFFDWTIFRDGEEVDARFTQSFEYTPGDDGSYVFQLRLSDGAQSVDMDSATVLVKNVAPSLMVADQTISEGQLLDLTGDGMGIPLGTFSDPGFLDTHTATVAWGDGSDMQPTDVSEASGAGTLGGSHIYADNGNYEVTVTIEDDDGGVTVEKFNVMVENVDPTLTGTDNVMVDEGQTFNLSDLGVALEDPGFDNPLNPNEQPDGSQELLFGDVINWGDGTADQPLTVFNRASGGEGVATTAQFQDAEHTYADNGMYTISLFVRDDDQMGFVMREFTITVNNVAPDVVPTEDRMVNEGALLSLTDIGTFTDPGFDNPDNPNQEGGSRETFEYEIEWGDGYVDSGTMNGGLVPEIDTPGEVGVATAGSFDGSHTYADDGVYTVTLRVFDDDGGIGTAEFFVTVVNLDPAFVPAADAPFMAQDIGADGLTTISVAFNDPGFDNPNNPNEQPGGSQESFTLIVHWGDDETFEVTISTSGVTMTGENSTILSVIRESGDIGILTTGSFVFEHFFDGPPNPDHPTADATIEVTIVDDNGGMVSGSVDVGHPGIGGPPQFVVFISPTIDVGGGPASPFTNVDLLVPQSGASFPALSSQDVRVGSFEMAAANESFYELRIISPDGTQSEGFRLKSESLYDIRKLFESLPDDHYIVYYVRTENNTRRLVIEVYVRDGRLIDPSDDSDGTRDIPPGEQQEIEEVNDAAPTDQQVPAEPSLDDASGGPVSPRMPVENLPMDVPTEFGPQLATHRDRFSRGGLPLAALGAAALHTSWTQHVEDALSQADGNSWRRLRRAARTRPHPNDPR